MTALTETKKHQFCKEALELKKEIEVDFLSLGAMLGQIQQDNLWEAGWDSWEEYMMELKMSQAVVSRLINIYRVFHVRFGVSQKKLAEAGGWSVVAEYLPMVTEKTTKEQVSEWIGGAATMTRDDVRKTITEAKTGISMAECKHKSAYKLFVCPDCGERHRI